MCTMCNASISVTMPYRTSVTSTEILPETLFVRVAEWRALEGRKFRVVNFIFNQISDTCILTHLRVLLYFSGPIKFCAADLKPPLL